MLAILSVCRARFASQLRPPHIYTYQSMFQQLALCTWDRAEAVAVVLRWFFNIQPETASNRDALLESIEDMLLPILGETAATTRTGAHNVWVSWQGMATS